MLWIPFPKSRYRRFETASRLFCVHQMGYAVDATRHHAQTDRKDAMKAIVYEKYGSPDVLQLQEIDKPAVNDDDVLIRVRAVGINPYDWHFMTGRPYIGRMQFGLLKPKVSGLGADLAGQVEAVGKKVTRFRRGDEVFGEVNGEVPGQPMLELGSFAEYVCVSEDSVVLKPANLTFEQAAAVPMAGLTALQCLRDQGRVESGQKVLINGASGGVGTFAVQIGKSFGAEVTGVCSARNVEIVRSIGANHVVDYMNEDFTESGRQYDVIVDCVGSHPLSDTRRALTANGRLVLVGGPDNGRWLGPLFGVLGVVVLSRFTRQKLLPFLARINRDDLLVMQQWLADGTVRPVIDRSYPLSEVPEAIRYLEEGHARGKVVIDV